MDKRHTHTKMTELVAFRETSDHLESLRLASSVEGLAVSEFIRQAIRSEIRRLGISHER